MQVVRDLAGGPKPSPLDLLYNAQDDADASETRYKGSLAKIMDWNNANGMQVTGVGESTAFENIIGILEESVTGASGYLLNDASYGPVPRKITPILPSSIVRAEYSRADAAGTANTESTCTGSAGGTTLTGTTTDIDVDDMMIGGWIYFVTGDNAGYLHYCTDSANSGETVTIATAFAFDVLATDTLLVTRPPMTLWLQADATYSGLKSTIDDGACTFPVVGLQYYITAPGIPFQRLDRDKHDGLKIANARLYHDFLVGGSATLGSVWRDTVVRA